MLLQPRVLLTCLRRRLLAVCLVAGFVLAGVTTLAAQTGGVLKAGADDREPARNVLLEGQKRLYDPQSAGLRSLSFDLTIDLPGAGSIGTARVIWTSEGGADIRIEPAARASISMPAEAVQQLARQPADQLLQLMLNRLIPGTTDTDVLSLKRSPDGSCAVRIVSPKAGVDGVKERTCEFDNMKLLRKMSVVVDQMGMKMNEEIAFTWMPVTEDSRLVVVAESATVDSPMGKLRSDLVVEHRNIDGVNIAVQATSSSDVPGRGKTSTVLAPNNLVVNVSPLPDAGSGVAQAIGLSAQAGGDKGQTPAEARPSNHTGAAGLPGQHPANGESGEDAGGKFIGWRGRTYVDEVLGFSVDVPSGWDVLSESEIAATDGPVKVSAPVDKEHSIDTEIRLKVKNKYSEAGLRVTVHTFRGEWPATPDQLVSIVQRSQATYMASIKWVFAGESVGDLGGHMIPTFHYYKDMTDEAVLSSGSYIRENLETCWHRLKGACLLQVDALWDDSAPQATPATVRSWVLCAEVIAVGAGPGSGSDRH